MIIFVFICGSIWMLIIGSFMWPNETTRAKLNKDFVKKYNESAENIPFIIADYTNPDLGQNVLLAIGFAAFISNSSLIFDAGLAMKIHYAIKNLNLSENVKKVHRTLLVTLIAQTAIPSFLTFIPCCICWFYPIFNLDWSFLCNSILTPMLSAYPLIDPLVITFALADYRETVFKLFGKKTILVVSPTNPDLGDNALFAMALATLISMSSIIFDVVLATKIHLAIKVLNSSEHVKKMHRILLITLIAQTVIPLILTFIPCFISWIYPLLKLDLSSFCNSLLAPMISSYPVIDPLVIILALADYREAVLKVFRKRTVPYLNNNNILFLETTCV
ncbi:unnamed protein product [Caenorhabditis angaria]|uniref:Uncharacterized protein n=1 Tax=Caenorhabditis angaria TaxID=860376 RepID=A0A9P1IRE4_9PELO|nr:unnamed protein product [Caenorhabditis angaria]